MNIIKNIKRIVTNILYYFLRDEINLLIAKANQEDLEFFERRFSEFEQDIQELDRNFESLNSDYEENLQTLNLDIEGLEHDLAELLSLDRQVHENTERINASVSHREIARDLTNRPKLLTPQEITQRLTKK